MSEDLTRRAFIAVSSSAAVAAASSLGQAQGANDRIRIGVIGTGGRGQYLMRLIAAHPGHEIVAVCDVYDQRLQQARKQTDDKADAYGDYRRILDRRDVDAVVIATPDHHHHDQFVDAIQAGKDVYQEKPLARTIDEGAEMVRVAGASKQVVQIGSQKRSAEHWRKAKEIVDSGRLGKITMVRMWDLRNWIVRDPFAPPADIPGKIDWTKFLGRAPKRAFDVHRYFAWRWYWDYAGGMVTDLGAHQLDAMQWLMGVQSAVSTVCHGGVYHFDYWETPDVVHQLIDYGKFSGQVTYEFHNSFEGDGGRFYGSEGTLEVIERTLRVYPQPRRAGEKVDTHRPDFEFEGNNDAAAHVGNWLQCLRSRATPNAPIEAAHTSITTAHLGNLSYRTGRMVRWDAVHRKAS